MPLLGAFHSASDFPLLVLTQPGGHLQIADMVRDPSVADSACCGTEGSWADCVSGTLAPEVFLSMIRTAGFRAVEVAAFTGYKTAASTIGALIKAIKPG